jgi:hypothetical protein
MLLLHNKLKQKCNSSARILETPSKVFLLTSARKNRNSNLQGAEVLATAFSPLLGNDEDQKQKYAFVT